MKNRKREPHMNGAGHVTIRPDSGQRATGRIQKCPTQSGHQSGQVLAGFTPVLSRQIFFLLPFEVRVYLKSNQTPTNHINHETKHLQAKIAYKSYQTRLYKCGSKFTIQKRRLDQNTLRVSSIGKLYKRIFKLAQLGNRIS